MGLRRKGRVIQVTPFADYLVNKLSRFVASAHAEHGRVCRVLVSRNMSANYLYDL